MLTLENTKEFKTVMDLIIELIPYHDRPLIIDDDGNTYSVDTINIREWDENDPNGPIAIFYPHV